MPARRDRRRLSAGADTGMQMTMFIRMRLVSATTVVLVLFTASAAAPECRKAIGCGSTSISTAWTCCIDSGHSGATMDGVPNQKVAASPAKQRSFDQAPPEQAVIDAQRNPAPRPSGAPAAARPPAIVAEPFSWIGLRAESICFRPGCSTELDLRVRNRRVFRVQADAKRAGLMRSQIAGSPTG